MTSPPASSRHNDALCPRCSGSGVPVVYGLPDDDLIAAAEAGLVSIGGCVVPTDVEVSTCPRCGELWSAEERASLGGLR